MILENFYKNRNVRIYDKIAPTIRSGRIGLLVMEKTRIEENKMTDKDGYTYRIRKLTPWECWRLMNIAGEDDINYKKAAEVNSATQLFKQAGNGIVRSVLMGIFSQLGIKGIKKWNDMDDDQIYNMVFNGSVS